MMHKRTIKHRAALFATVAACAASFATLGPVLLAHADPARQTIRLPPAMAVDAAAWEAGASSNPAANPDAAPAEFRITRTPPDPTPFVTRDQWIFDLRYDHGDIFLADTRTWQMPAAQATPRVMGRFALELFEGPTLIERVRFDFPFLGAVDEHKDSGIGSFGVLDRRVISRIGVIFPRIGRGTRLELRDRATDERWALPWPPPAPAPGNPGNAGNAGNAGSGQMDTPADAARGR